MNTRHFLPLMLTAALAAAAVGPDYRTPPTPPSSDRTRRRPSWSRMRRPTGRTRRPDAGGGCTTTRRWTDWWNRRWPPIPTCAWPPPIWNARKPPPAKPRPSSSPASASTLRPPSATSPACRSCSRASIPSRWSYSAGASVSYQLDLFGQIRRAVEAASGDEQAARAAYDATRVTVAAETARAYANMCAAGMQLASARHSVEVQTASLDAVERLQRAGRGTALDVTRASRPAATAAGQPAAVPGPAAHRAVPAGGADRPHAGANSRQPAAMRHGAAPDPDHSGGRRRRAAASPSRHPPGRTQPGRRHRPHRRGHGRPVPQDLAGLSGASGGPAAIAFGDRGTFSWSIGPLISWTIPNTGAAQARIAQAEAGTAPPPPASTPPCSTHCANGKRADRLCAPARSRKRAASRARAERPGRQPGAPVVPIWQDRLPDGAGRRTHAGRQRKRLAAARRTQQRPDRRVPGAGRRLGGRGEPDRRH